MEVDNNHLRLSLVASLLIVSLSVAYYLVIFLPEQQRLSDERLRAKDQQEQRDRTAKSEEERRDREFKNELECKSQYDKLRNQFNNVITVSYSSTLNTCMVHYTSSAGSIAES